MGELRVEHVPCFLHTEIQGEKIPDVPYGMPFTKDFLDKILVSCPVVVEIIKDEDDKRETGLLGRDGSGIGLHRISSNHGRSYELTFGVSDDINRPIAIWADDHDNVYGSFSLKGNNFSNPHIMKSLTAPSEYIPFGLQETDSFLRVIRASRIMTEANVGTEKIIRVIEPQQFRVPAFDPDTDMPIENEFEYVSLAECKRRLLITHWNEIADRPDATEEFAKASKAIHEMSFFITLRAMSVGNRILDLCDAKESFIPQLEHIFRVLEPTVIHDEGEGPLNVENKEHIEWFFTNYLPTTIGINLAKLHKLKLMHTFPTLGNINALGDLIDLDSVKGAPLGLGDKELNDDDYFSDLLYFMHDGSNRADLASLAKNFVTAMDGSYIPDLAFADFIDENHEQELGSKLIDIFAGNFNAKLISTYINERFDMGEECNIDEENLIGFLDFVELEIKKGEGFGYDSFIKEILQHHLEDTSYEELIDDEAIDEVTAKFIEWGNEHAADILQRIIMSSLEIQNSQGFDNDAEIEIEVFSKALAESAIVERLFRHNTSADYLGRPETITKIAKWIDANRKSSSPLSRDSLARAVTLGLRDKIARDALKLSFKSSSLDKVKTNYFVEQLAPGLYTNTILNAEVHGLLVDNTLAALWARVPREILEEAISPSENITLITHDIQPIEETISITSTDSVRIQQVFHDGGIIESLHIKSLGKYGEGGLLTFKPDPNDTYIAWSILDENANTLHLYMQCR